MVHFHWTKGLAVDNFARVGGRHQNVTSWIEFVCVYIYMNMLVCVRECKSVCVCVCAYIVIFINMKSLHHFVYYLWHIKVI